MDKSEFGKRLKKARIARRMTQSELAGDKVTRNMISRIENGVSVPSIGTLGRQLRPARDSAARDVLANGLV
mgnify:CR=1 FL=1